MSKVLGISKKPVPADMVGPRSSLPINEVKKDVCIGPYNPELPLHEGKYGTYTAELLGNDVVLTFPDGSTKTLFSDDGIDSLSIAIGMSRYVDFCATPPEDRYSPAFDDQSFVPLGASAEEVESILSRPKATSWVGSDQGYVMCLTRGVVESDQEHSACTEGFMSAQEQSVRTDRVIYTAYGAQFRLPEVSPEGSSQDIALISQFQIHEGKDPNFLVIVSAIRYKDNSAILQFETRDEGIISQVPFERSVEEVHFLHNSDDSSFSVVHLNQTMVRIERDIKSVAFRINVGRRVGSVILQEAFIEASLCSDLRWLQDPIDTHWRSLTTEPHAKVTSTTASPIADVTAPVVIIGLVDTSAGEVTAEDTPPPISEVVGSFVTISLQAAYLPYEITEDAPPPIADVSAPVVSINLRRVVE